MQDFKSPRLLIWLCLFALPYFSYAQNTRQTTYCSSSSTPVWAVLMYNSPDQVEEIRSGFEEWRLANPEVKNQHSQYYKRWMRQIQSPSTPLDDAYLERVSGNSVDRAGNWTEMGPWHYDPEVAMYFEVQSPGACHVYTVEQSYSNPDIIYCGTATAGMWRSIDKGLHWNLITHDLPVTGVYSIAIDSNNPDLIWLGAGNGQLYRSENGGVSWTTCGSSAFQNINRWYRDLAITDQGLFAATDNGLFHSSDGGNTMNLIQSGEFMELEFHPTDPSIVYTVKLQGVATLFERSTDGGLTFTSVGVGMGWPIISIENEQKRAEIAISAAEPDAVYVLAAGSTLDGGGLYGYYMSHDAGLTFEQACCGGGPGGPWVAETNPNILGWSGDGSEDGGQYYYDLALGASPTDPSRQFAAGISVWRTETAGASWDLNAHWVTWAGDFTSERYTHADVHDVKFFTQPDGTVDMWIASDGGLYYSSNQGDNIEPRMYGLHGTDFWGWQAGWRGNNVMLGGTYHNGTLIRNDSLYHWGADSDTSGGWLAELAGDNFRGFVNPGDPSIGYHDGGKFKFSNNRFERISGDAFDNSKLPNTSYWLGEYGNMEWDPTCYNRFYSPVGSELWRTDDGGESWTLVHDFSGEKIISVQIAPLDPNRIYVSHKYNGSNWKIHRSDDGGATWQEISLTSTESGTNLNKAIYLDTDDTDPNRAYAVLLGTQDGYKVFQTFNAGETWQNLTTSTLNNEHVISIAHQRGTDGGLYLGTTRAVYYRDDSMTDWELYNSGLPIITPATFLQPDYCGGNIRAAGSRSVHQSPFHSPSSTQAALMADKTTLNLANPCNTPPIHFTDVSVAKCEGSTYNWEFEGGYPATAIGTDVYVNYLDTGLFDVTLTVTQSDGGTDSITWTDLISVINEPVVGIEGFYEDFDGPEFPPENWRLESAGAPWEHAYELQDSTNGVAQFPNYWVDTQQASDLLILPSFNPNTGWYNLQFYVAYMTYSTYIDGLEVWGRLAGEEEWTVLWEAYGVDLAVTDCYIWFWSDTNGTPEWDTHIVEFPPYWAGNIECAEIAFANIGGYGNHIWLDNISLNQTSAVNENEARLKPIIYPNPSSGEIHIKTPDIFNDNYSYNVIDNQGRSVSNGICRENLTLNLSPGMYVFNIIGGESVRFMIQ